MTALVGLGTILSALTLVWLLSVRLRDASIADICWGPGFVQLAWLFCLLSPALTQRSWLVAALDHAVGRAAVVHIFRRNHGKGEDPRYQAMRASHGRGILVAEPLHGLLAAGRDPVVRRPPAPRRGARHGARRTHCSRWPGSLALRGWVWLRGRRRLSTRALQGRALRTAARCSIAGCGATRGIRTTSETPRCGGACMPSRHQRQADGSPC